MPTTDTETLTEHQKDLEYLFSKNQLIPRLKLEFSKPEAGFLVYLEEHQIEREFGLGLLVQMAILKRANVPTLVGILRHHHKTAQETMDAIKHAVEEGLLDWSANFKVFIVKYDIPPELKSEFDHFQFPLPMVVEPTKLECNTQSGYLLNQTSVILKHNHHEDDVCLDHLNRMNQIKLTINFDVVNMVKNKWKNLDKPKTAEDWEDYQTRVKAFNKYDTTAHKVMSILVKYSDNFYLTHRYDKRGRVYSMGYHVNYQGNSWNKAVISFYNTEIVP